MSIEFACPHCQKPYRVKKELAGKTARCAVNKFEFRRRSRPDASRHLTDLFVEADEQNQPLASASPKLKSSYPKTAPFSVGIGSGPLQNLLKGGGLMIAKLGGGAVAGAALAIWYFIRDEKAGAYELSMKIAFTLVAAAMGVGAAAVLDRRPRRRKKIELRSLAHADRADIRDCCGSRFLFRHNRF